MKVSEHFSSEEFACKCGCGKSEVNAKLLSILEDIRCHFDSPTTLTSVNRCEEYNKKVGGAKKSQHLFSTAADVVVRGVEAPLVQAYVLSKYEGMYGIGCYKTFTHVDVREGCARWVG